MENLFALSFLDLSPNPVRPLPWTTLIMLLAVIFVLAVAFAAALVCLLIWFKRRKVNIEASD